MRAISRRTSRTRAVFSSWPLALRKRRLNASLRRSTSDAFSWSGVLSLTSSAFISTLLAQASHETRLDRQLGRRQGERFDRQRLRHAIDLEHDPAGMDADHPVFGRALTRAHADFGRLARHRNVREHADPDTTQPLHVAGDGAAGGLDLARGDAAGLGRLQAIGTEIEIGAGLGLAVNAALVGLTEFRALRLKHDCRSLLSCFGL